MNKEQESKRFYWIKLKTDFYSDDNGAVAFLLSQPNGANYVVIYQMLCLMSANQNGELAYNVGEIIVPYDVDKITRECKYFSRDTVITALNLYKQLGLIYQSQDGMLVVANLETMVGSETAGAQKKRLQRERNREKSLPENTSYEGDTEGDTEGDIVPKRLEIRDKRLEIRDKNIYNTHTQSARSAREERANYSSDRESKSWDRESKSNDEELRDLPSSKPIDGNFGNRFNEFVERWGIYIDTSTWDLADFDFDKLDEAFRNSTKFLQKYEQYHFLSWIVKNYARIIKGKYKDIDFEEQARADRPIVDTSDPDYDISGLDKIHYD